MDLWHVAEAGRDKHLTPRRMPARESGGPKLGVGAYLVGDLHWDGRNAVDDKILVGSYDTLLANGRSNGTRDEDEGQG